jgi:hypothetical protein
MFEDIKGKPNCDDVPPEGGQACDGRSLRDQMNNISNEAGVRNQL